MTFKSSRVLGFSGSRMVRKKSKTPQHNENHKITIQMPKTTQSPVKTNRRWFLSGHSHLCIPVLARSHFCPYKQVGRAPRGVSRCYSMKVSRRKISYRNKLTLKRKATNSRSLYLAAIFVVL